MNKQKLLLFALVTIVSIGCISCRTQRVSASTVAYSTDSQDTRTYDVGSFNAINMSGVSTIYFTQGSQLSVSAKATTADLNRMKIYVQNGCLYVANNNNERVHYNQGCDIYITAPKLSALKMSGACSFKAKTLKAGEFNLNISGVSDFNVPDIKCNDTQVNISGVGNINISVEGDRLSVLSSGVAHTDICFKGKVADIHNSGVGSMSVNLDCDEVKARNSGQSTLKLKGHADKTNVESSGVASIDTSELNQY